MSLKSIPREVVFFYVKPFVEAWGDSRLPNIKIAFLELREARKRKVELLCVILDLTIGSYNSEAT